MTTQGEDRLLSEVFGVKLTETQAFEVARDHEGTPEVLGYVIRRPDVPDKPWTAYATLTTVGRDWLGLHPTFREAVHAIKQADAELQAEEDDA